MSELDKMVVGFAAALIVICLVGPATLWRFIEEAAAWMLIILILIWAL